jgi:hypothetical protein
MRVVSSASSKVRRGKMEGMERAISVFPAPGGPLSKTLWAQFSQSCCTICTDYSHLTEELMADKPLTVGSAFSRDLL